MSKIKLTPLKDGPLLLVNAEFIFGKNGEKIEAKEKSFLCRCGASSNKPFCDGTHNKTGYSSDREQTRSNDYYKTYEGKEIIINDNRTICSHAAVCVSKLAEVFDVENRPWINADGATAEKIKEVIKKCPSGALTFVEKDKVVTEWSENETVSFEKNGPYLFQGGIEIENDPQPPVNDHYVICRCGKSKNKPYCDGNHHNYKFDS
ncbi:MAG: hypothetical protein SCALA702_17880 [Melioribacteraceae bacterium]|nr:MAG: hypothetical protein SCALA702_17880 [Melioribacteraceae bacterium]